MKIPEIELRIQKKFSVSKINAFEFGATNLQNPEHDVSYCQSMS